jgi:hypoxanthine-DNA glycosylase
MKEEQKEPGNRVECLDALAGKGPVVLILGTMPGLESLEKKEYYANRGNRFWKILFEYFGEKHGEDYKKRTGLVQENHIALWDVLKFCDRKASIDANISNGSVNDIEKFLRENHSTIRAVFLNGRKAGKYYKKHFAVLKVEAIYLPSTSGANRRTSEKDLFDKWKAALDKYI